MSWDCISSSVTRGKSDLNSPTNGGISQVPKDSWKANRTTPVSGSVNSCIAAKVSSRTWMTWSTPRLNSAPA